MNDGHPREAVGSLGPRDVVPGHGVSYRDGRFLAAFACGITGLNSIELNGLGERNVQGLQEFLAFGLLAVNAGDFLDLADPPICILLYYRSIGLLHFFTSDTGKYTESIFERFKRSQ